MVVVNVMEGNEDSEAQLCICHKVARSVSFTSSLAQPACWCGLTRSCETADRDVKAQEDEQLPHASNTNISSEASQPFISTVPIILNAKFWKCNVQDAFLIWPELKSKIHCGLVNNSYFNLCGNYLVGSAAGHGTFSKARRALRRDVTGTWTVVALKVRRCIYKKGMNCSMFSNTLTHFMRAYIV